VLFAGLSQEFWKKKQWNNGFAMNLILKEMFWLLMNCRFPCPACDLKFEKG